MPIWRIPPRIQQTLPKVTAGVTTVPTVTTQAASSVTDMTAIGNGNITGLGEMASCDHRGIVYDILSHADPGNTAPAASAYAYYVDQNGTYYTGAFTESLTSLSELTIYHARAYAHNANGYAYGNEVSFETSLVVTTPNLILPVLQIAWASNPFDAVPVWVNVTADLLDFSFTRGRQHELDKFETGTLTFTLLNTSGNYWPNNTSGIYYPNVDLKKRVRIRAYWNGVFYDRYVGYTSKFTPSWRLVGMLCPVMTIECADAMSLISKQVLNTSYSQEKSGVREGHVLDTVGFMAADRSIDTGTYNVIASTLVNINALDHANLAALSEFGLFYIAANGYAVGESIDHRVGHTSQVTFVDNYRDVKLLLDDTQLYNQIRATRAGGAEQVASNSANIAKYGLQVLTRAGLLLTDDSIVSTYAAYVLARYSFTSFRAYSLPLSPYSMPSLIPAILLTEISTKITVTVPSPSGISADYFVEKITEAWNGSDPAGWTIQFQLSDATHYYSPTPGSLTQDITIRPNGISSSSFVIAYPSGTLNGVASDSDNSTYIKANYFDILGSGYANLHLADTGDLGGTINSVTFYWTIRRQATKGTNLYIILNSVTYTPFSNYIPGFSWETKSQAYATSPNTGIAWTWAEVNSLIQGFSFPAEDWPWMDTIDCAEMHAVINYTITW